MRNILVLASLLALLACGRSVEKVDSPAEPPAFEIRDFKVEKLKEGDVVLAKGRGTLVTRDSRLLSGTYIVWITVKKAHRNDREQRYAVVVKDGVGNIETQDRLDEFDALLLKTTSFSDWRVIGYAPLQPARLVVPVAASAPN